MRIIGITGGIGSGKTLVLNILKSKYNAYVIEADSLAHQLMEKDQEAYLKIVDFFGCDILDSNGEIHREKLGAIVFAHESKLKQLNSIVHPIVKKNILEQISVEEKNGRDLFVIEAALLIQDGYRNICQELWYVYSSLDVRIERLIKYRSFTKEKALSVINSQDSDEFYKKNCDKVLDNSFDVANTKTQIAQLYKNI